MQALASYIENQGGQIVFSGDAIEDERKYNDPKGNEVFLRNIERENPDMFIVGCGHLDYLRQRLPAHTFVCLPNRRYMREMRRYLPRA